MSRIVITGIGSLRNPGEKFVRDELARFGSRMTQAKLSTDIERISVLASAYALESAGILSPLGDDSISIYAGIDEGIDSIKFRYYEGVLKEGPLGASPALFPLTSPNAVSAQIAIDFDARGECITFPAGMLSGARAISYASECIMLGKTDIALAGGATCIDDELREALKDSGNADAGKLISGAAFLVLESDEHAKGRGAKIYGRVVWYFEAFWGEHNIKGAVDEIISACAGESGIKKDDIGFINILTQENISIRNPKVKIFKSSALSASFAILISDYLLERDSGDLALFIANDPSGNVLAVLVESL